MGPGPDPPDRRPHRDPRRHRHGPARDPARAPVVPAGDRRRAVRRAGGGQPAAHRRVGGAARQHRRPQRPGAREQHDRREPGRPAARAAGPAPRRRPQPPGAGDRRAGVRAGRERRGGRRPAARAGGPGAQRGSRRVAVPGGAPARLPRHQPPEDVPALVPGGPDGRPHPGPDRAYRPRGDRRLPAQGLPGRRDGRQERRRAAVRGVPDRHARPRRGGGRRRGRAAGAGVPQLARAGARPQHPALHRPADPAGARERPGRRGRRHRREGRGGRGDGPPHGRGARPGVLPDVQPGGLRQAQGEGDRADQQGRGLPAPGPRDRRRLPGRLHLQADHRGGSRRQRPARRGRGARVVLRHHAPQAGVPQLRAAVARDDHPADGARGVERHVLLPGGRPALAGPERGEARLSAPGGGARVRPGPPHGRRPAQRERRERARPAVEAEGVRRPAVHGLPALVARGRHDPARRRTGLHAGDARSRWRRRTPPSRTAGPS